MSYLSLVIAWIKMNGSDLVGNQWWDAFFDTLVGVEKWFFGFSWVIFGIVLVVAIAFFLMGRNKGSVLAIFGGFFFGCFAVFLMFMPLWEWLTLSFARGMAGSFGPEGIMNQGKFFTSLLLYIFFGIG